MKNTTFLVCLSLIDIIIALVHQDLFHVDILGSSALDQRIKWHCTFLCLQEIEICAGLEIIGKECILLSYDATVTESVDYRAYRTGVRLFASMMYHGVNITF